MAPCHEDCALPAPEAPTGAAPAAKPPTPLAFGSLNDAGPSRSGSASLLMNPGASDAANQGSGAGAPPAAPATPAGAAPAPAAAASSPREPRAALQGSEASRADSATTWQDLGRQLSRDSEEVHQGDMEEGSAHHAMEDGQQDEGQGEERHQEGSKGLLQEKEEPR